MPNQNNNMLPRKLGFQMDFAPTDYLHLLNDEQAKECFDWMDKNKCKRINDWPGWEKLGLPH